MFWIERHFLSVSLKFQISRSLRINSRCSSFFHVIVILPIQFLKYCRSLTECLDIEPTTTSLCLESLVRNLKQILLPLFSHNKELLVSLIYYNKLLNLVWYVAPAAYTFKMHYKRKKCWYLCQFIESILLQFLLKLIRCIRHF